ncbi:Lyso-phosphatidylcholine acyltransferase [Tilletia horrida]|uniref:Tafazzin family protein n=1 Tax=Tilletia horrida TaxID=155126 RepID=A0AAN6GCV7_9BASI|nr:Lyso-phosphatidylcholine acyltransferase [Tilletia horrida]
MDEPLLWGSLPFTKHGTQKLIASARSRSPSADAEEPHQHQQNQQQRRYRSPFVSLHPAENARWTLAASDIVYLNSALGAFFNTGQVLETYRGASPFQPALDTAIDQLDRGRWVHIFPEGYVNLSLTTDLRRFKWGISRIAMESDRAPLCIPIWITGFDQIMPEPRAKPRWLPRPGASVSITFGRPVSRAAMRDVLSADSRCVGSVPSTAEMSKSDAGDAEAQRRKREEAYWNEAWQPDAATLGEPEDWEISSDYASSSTQNLHDMATAAISAASARGAFSTPPPMSHFPPIAAHRPPPGGWPINPPGSRAARASELESLDPNRAKIRSSFAAMLRDEMGRLGLCVRRAMGDGEGEGRLAHTIMETRSSDSP